MAMSRKFLSGLGLESGQIEAIVEANDETINGLREERDALRAKADKAAALQRQVDELRADTSLADLQKKYEEDAASHKKEVARLKGELTTANNKLAEAEKARDEAVAETERVREEGAQAVAAKQQELDDAVAAANGERDGIQTQFDEYKAGVEAKEATRAKAAAYRTQVLAAAGIAPNYIDDVMGVTQLDGIELGEDGTISDAEKLVEAAREKWGSFVLREKTVPSSVETPPEDAGTPEVEGAHPIAERIARGRHERLYGVPNSQ